jgi:hypothetical protein
MALRRQCGLAHAGSRDVMDVNTKTYQHQQGQQLHHKLRAQLGTYQKVMSEKNVTNMVAGGIYKILHSHKEQYHHWALKGAPWILS